MLAFEEAGNYPLFGQNKTTGNAGGFVI